MKFNDCHYEVDTQQAERLSESEWQKDADGYSHETDKMFIAWKSGRSQRWFITMTYVEHIAGIFGFGRKTIRGESLVRIYGTPDELREGMLRYGIRIPPTMLKQA